MSCGRFWREFSVFRELFGLGKIFFRRQKKLLAVSLVLGFFAETLAMAMPSLTGNLAATLGNWHSFRQAAALFLAVGLVQFLFAVANDVFDRLLKDRLDRDAFCFTHEAVLSLDPASFHENSGGESLTNVSAARGAAMEVLELICFPVFYGGGLVAGLVFLFRSLRGIHLPVWLTLLLVGGMAMQPFLTWYFGKLIARAFVFVRETSKESNDVLLDDLRAPVELRLMNALKRRFFAMFKIQHRLALFMDKALLLHIASRYSMSLLILLFQFAIVLSVLCHYDIRSAVVRDLVAAILLIPLMFNHLNKLQQMYNNVMDQKPYIGKLAALFAARSALPRGKENFRADALPSVEFRNVVFGYEKNDPVLRGLSLKADAGRCSAFVSASGAGKTTALKLLARLYMPQQGEIFAGDQNLVDITEFSWRKSCIVLSQFPLFIQGTIRDNVRLQVPDATDAGIIGAARTLGLAQILDAEVEKIPDLEVTSGADNLSGGQRKLLALMRALLAKPKLLLLDEPSVGIDGETIRDHLLPALKKFKGETTMIVVDHNLDFVSEIADAIFFFRDGKSVTANADVR